YQIRIGQLGIISGVRDVPSPPTGLYVEEFNQIDDDHGTVRLRWDHSANAAYTYNVYRVNADETRTWLWSTPGEACFVPEVTREAPETSTTLEVVTVGEEFGVSSAATATIDWTITGIRAGGTGSVFGLSGDYPNPVTSNVEIRFSLCAAGPVELLLYAMDGRLVGRLAEGVMQAGEHTATLQTRDLSSGIYFIRLASGNRFDTGRCLVIR
ncbi:MAG: T9SS type A sorting domain-containing protein, partial [Candidatus Fermentibacteraceae bacterium]|nr:T9SS type A sorting domain-containing protein [Candidatus Fermentibacteraceae bacterium]